MEYYLKEAMMFKRFGVSVRLKVFRMSGFYSSIQCANIERKERMEKPVTLTTDGRRN